MDKMERQLRHLRMEQESHQDIMNNRENDIKELDASLRELKENFDQQIEHLAKENKQLNIQLSEAREKNSKLIKALEEK